MIKCPECEGDGFCWDHAIDCDGTCSEGDCPIQIRCPNLSCKDGWVEE